MLMNYYFCRNIDYQDFITELDKIEAGKILPNP